MGKRDHTLTLRARAASQRLRGTVVESPVLVEDDLGRVVRRVEFGPSATVIASDRAGAAWLCGTYGTSGTSYKLTLERGWITIPRPAAWRPSARVGIRWALDNDAVTVIRAGYGSFVGSLPLPSRPSPGTRRDSIPQSILRTGRNLDTTSSNRLSRACDYRAQGRQRCRSSGIFGRPGRASRSHGSTVNSLGYS